MFFYSTFPSGLQAPVARLLRGAVHVLDGAVLYEADALPDTPWANNTFEAICWENKKINLNRYMKKILSAPPSMHNEAPGHFRIVVSEENTLVSVDPAIKNKMEKHIAAQTGLTPERGGAGLEYWFLSRSEGFVFFLKRLTYHTSFDKALPKGALTPPLAYLLNVLAEPAPGDTMLDPFCGSGAITAAARRYFPYKKVLESDKTAGKEIAALFSWLPRRSVNKIVTDPPWGLYDETRDIRSLYDKMPGIFLHLTARGGTIVVLTSQKDLLREILSCKKTECLRLRRVYDILVNGRKAGVFVIHRE
jgi:hypothetical protein